MCLLYNDGSCTRWLVSQSSASEWPLWSDQRGIGSWPSRMLCCISSICWVCTSSSPGESYVKSTECQSGCFSNSGQNLLSKCAWDKNGPLVLCKSCFWYYFPLIFQTVCASVYGTDALQEYASSFWAPIRREVWPDIIQICCLWKSHLTLWSSFLLSGFCWDEQKCGGIFDRGSYCPLQGICQTGHWPLWISLGFLPNYLLDSSSLFYLPLYADKWFWFVEELCQWNIHWWVYQCK